MCGKLLLIVSSSLIYSPYTERPTIKLDALKDPSSEVIEMMSENKWEEHKVLEVE